MGYGISEVVHTPTRSAFENNCALVQDLRRWAILDVYGKEIGVLRTEPLNEILAHRVVS